MSNERSYILQQTFLDTRCSWGKLQSFCTLLKTLRDWFQQIVIFLINVLLLHFLTYYSLGARDGFTQPIFYRRCQFVNQTKYIKKIVVSCDVIGGITLGTKLKMPIFTLYLPHNLQSRVLVFQKFIRFQIKLTSISVTKGWSDQEVNTQIDKIPKSQPIS